MQEPTAIDRVLSFPYRIYEFIMFFIMTLIDVRARSELLSSLCPRIMFFLCFLFVRPSNLIAIPPSAPPSVAAQGGQEGQRKHAELERAQRRCPGGWQWHRHAPEPPRDGQREEQREQLRPRGRMRLSVARHQMTRDGDPSHGMPFL